MGTLKGTAEKAIGKIKEVVADIAGDGKLSEQDKAEQQLADESKNEFQPAQSTRQFGSAHLNSAAPTKRNAVQTPPGENHMLDYPRPPFAEQQQPLPGVTNEMSPVPDHGETSYKGSNRLSGKKAVITGGDSGIGRAVALAFAREGADVLISYLSEDRDARETERLVKEAGRKAVLVPGDLQNSDHCRAVIAKAVSEIGRH